MKYRLGFDLGYSSIGWASIDVDDDNKPIGVRDLGVRIIPSGRDAKSFKPTSVMRRDKRGARRNRDRYLSRRERLLSALIELGLQPACPMERKALAQQDPLPLRAKGITDKLSLFELGRALFHLNQRRGFRSNRIADRKENSEEKGLKLGIHQLETILTENQQTLGQYLYQLQLDNQPTRLNKDAAQDRWTSRKMYLQEYQQLMKTQQAYYPELLTDQVIEKLQDIIFFQRDLLPQEAGYCALIEGEKRARLAYSEVQQFRIYQEVNNLDTIQEYEGAPFITADMRKKLTYYLCEDFSKLNSQKMLTWSAIQKIIGLKGVKFNLDTQGCKGLLADTTAYAMTTLSKPWWTSLTRTQQHSIIDIMLTAQSDQQCKSLLSQLDFAIPAELIEQLLQVKLKDGYGNVSLVAIEKIMPYLKAGDIYSKACAKAGINHSDDFDGVIYPQGDLPYYGEIMPKHVIGGQPIEANRAYPERYYGKINNPTVHIVLNQLRKIINELVKRYGEPPQEIYIEMARDTALSADELSKLKSKQTRNRKDNERINAILTEMGEQPSYNNRMKYHLWEDLDSAPNGRCCPLSGKAISLEQLFSAEVEVEHIIPFSRSFDDSRNNKMVCFKSANHRKADKTPFEAFGDKPEWQAILARAKKMSPDENKNKGFRVNKYWRFLPDAMKKLDVEGDSYIARQLNDTRYMACIARRYAESVVGKYKVHTLKGKFTSDLRHHWGLDRLVNNSDTDKKDRSYNHHHAIDALIVALSDRNCINLLTEANKRSRKLASTKLFLNIPKPYSDFSVEDIQEKLDAIIISHKQDHKDPNLARQQGNSIGQLHEETNYGHIVANIYATRVPFMGINFDTLKNINEIAHPKIRQELKALWETYANQQNRLDGENQKAYYQAFEQYAQQTGIKRIRIHLEKENLIAIKDKNGNAYRYVLGGNNFCAEIWVTDKGKKAGKWQTEIIRNFDVNQKGFMPKWRQENPTATKIMRLQINDMVAIDKDGERIICRVQKMDVSGRIILRNHDDSTTDFKTEIATFASSLQKYNARKLFVSPAGKIYDPGRAKQPKQK